MPFVYARDQLLMQSCVMAKKAAHICQPNGNGFKSTKRPALKGAGCADFGVQN